MKSDFKKYIPPALAILGLYLVIRYWAVLEKGVLLLAGATAPLFLGFSIAYVVDLPMSFYERLWFKKKPTPLTDKLRRPVCLTLAILTIVAIVVFLVLMVLPELGETVRFLIAEIPPLFDRILDSEFVTQAMPGTLIDKLSSIDWQGLSTQITDLLMNKLGSIAETLFSVIGTVIGWLITVVVAVVFAVYALYSKETLTGQLNRLLKTYLSENAYSRILYFGKVINESFHNFIVGQCLDAIILGSLTMIGMVIFGFPYAGMVGALVGFLAIIPYVGAYISAGIGALMILTVSPIKALLFLVFLIVLQQIEGNFIYPKVVGSSIGLPAIWVLAAITVGGTVAGIFGMLVGVPIFAVLYRLVRHDVRHREAEKSGKKVTKTVPEPVPEEK